MASGSVGMWPQTQNMLLSHFRDSTIQFLWEENTALSSLLFHHCILLHCILISFDFIRLQQYFELNGNPIYSRLQFACDICDHNHTVNYNELIFKEDALKWILRSNARVIFNQRFTLKDLLLVSDSIFPSKRFGHGVLQTEIDRKYRYIPMKVPTVILLETSLTTGNILKVVKSTRIVISEMTSALLIFVDSNLKFVSIGCFTCEQFVEHYAKWKSVPMYPVTFQSIPTKLIGTFQNLGKYWRKLHSKIQFENSDNNIDHNCYSILNRNKDETCETYKSFFKEKNCSSFTFCTYYFSDDLKLQSITSNLLHFKYLSLIFPFVLKHTDFTFQVLLPKVRVLESGLGAYLTPFDIKIWICTVISIVVIFLWFWGKEEDNFTQVVFWQFATLIEQDGPQLTLKKTRLGGKTIVLIWIMVAILLRLFYTASLYSFMTAEIEPDDFPQTIEEVVNRDDFEFLLTPEFFTKLNSWFWEHSSNHLPQVRNFYFGIITKAVFVTNRHLEIQTLQNLSNGNSVRVVRYPHVNTNVHSRREFFSTHSLLSVEKAFLKVATLCEGDCNSNSNVGLVGQKIFHRIIPEQRSPLLRSFEFWTLRFTNFATLSFSKFFGSFIHSGLYELSIKHYKLLSQVKNMRKVNKLGTLKMSNASLFSFVFLADQKEVFVEEEDPTKLSALKGTLLIGTFMLSAASTVFLFELRSYILNKWASC
ncbi:unnamed protein product [Orchesella dallaii]|uniref:Uncharacterized protein n=1 Tax=Orchesella dallaii TaxID=48710 RepID=A0ABP1RHL4_9HEXA